MPALVPDLDVHPADILSDSNNRSAWINQDDVVISGMSARLPESDSVAEFEKNLYDGVDMVTDDERRWPAGKSNTWWLLASISEVEVVKR